MTVTVRVNEQVRWQDLVSGLAAGLASSPPGPFESLRVVTSSRGASRMLSQALATTLPTGISAGITFLTVREWIRSVAEEHNLLAELDAWRTVRAAVVAADVLKDLSGHHRVLGAHLTAGGSPARRQQVALRMVELLRRYVEHAPTMVERWLDGEDVDAHGVPLAEHLAWQPDVLRHTAERLETDPLEIWSLLAESASQDTRPLHVFAVSDVSPAEQHVLDAAASSAEVTHWRVTPAPGATAPIVSLHSSHGRGRQVEVLRDELTRRFEADPTLEPRDVLVVCQSPRDWWPHLQVAFAPADGDPTAHPGRHLRVQAGGALEPNLVLEVIRRCLGLADSRATATQISELFLLPPVAHRWRLGPRREELLELVAEAGIRWGLDKDHRAHLGLTGIAQNTWVRGLDRLLVGLAAAPGTDPGLGITGSGTVGTSDLDLIGTVAELVSRLRRFNVHASGTATGPEWVERVRVLLADLVGCPFDDEWMMLQATSALTDLAEQLADQPAILSRTEFTRLFEHATREFVPRPTVGNGALQVVGVGELQHVDFRLVCVLGVTDAPAGADVDVVDLGDDVVDARRLRLQRLLDHARATDELLIISQGRDPLTDREVARPTAISWLLRELGTEDVRPHQHPLLAHSEANFTGAASFDQQGLATALALRAASPTAPPPHALRRRAAVALPVKPGHHEVTCRELNSFLADPARDFLRSVAEVRIWENAGLLDEMPLVLNGLEEWQARDRFLEAFRQGLTPTEAAMAEVQREMVPPQRIGAAVLRKPLAEVTDLWRQAWPQWSADPTDHRIELELGDVTLADTIRTRGGAIVHVSVSDGLRPQVEPWLQQLALAAAGVEVPAHVHLLQNDFGDRSAVEVTLPAPDRDVATATLRTITRAWALGRHRLIPLPQDLALAFCTGLVRNSLDRAQWQVPAPSWQSLWRRFSEPWRLFYSGVPDEVFTDPAMPEDPEPPPAGMGSAFAAWATAIYAPLLGGSR